MSTATIEKPQHLMAIERANEVRVHQVEMCRQLANSTISLEKVLLDERMASATLERVVRALPTKPGSATNPYARHKHGAWILGRTNLPGDRKVGSLTDLSRSKLLDAAWDSTGQTAWIFEVDKKPQPAGPTRPRKRTVPREASMKALEIANEVRRENCEIRNALERGDLTLREAFELPAVQKWQIGQLAKHLRRTNMAGDSWLKSMSPTAARRELARAKLAPQTRVGALSEWRRQDLIARFALARFCRPGTTVKEVIR